MTKLTSPSDGFPGTAAIGDLVATAGQRPADEVRGAGFAAEFESALAGTADALEAAGGALDGVLHLHVFVTDMSAYLEVRPALQAPLTEHFAGRVPPTTVIEVGALAGDTAVEIEALAGRRRVPEDVRPADGPADATLRVRLGPGDARYAGGLVPGSKAMELFGDLETEIALREGGDEGLCVAYDMVEFLAPLHVGDYLEASARVVSRGRTSRRLYAELLRVRAVDANGVDASPEAPVLVARASVTIVVGRTPRGQR
jgi:enamine deaminase RidA (YjgF/YER057c/UK114 family)/acyl-CoA hydrolase